MGNRSIGGLVSRITRALVGITIIGLLALVMVANVSAKAKAVTTIPTRAGPREGRMNDYLIIYKKAESPSTVFRSGIFRIGAVDSQIELLEPNPNSEPNQPTTRIYGHFRAKDFKDTPGVAVVLVKNTDPEYPETGENFWKQRATLTAQRSP